MKKLFTSVSVLCLSLAAQTGIAKVSPEEAATAVFRKQIPLFGLGGAATLGALPSEKETSSEMDM